MSEIDENGIIMYAYKNASEGATMVADAMEIFKLKHEGSTWVPRRGRTVINWGAGSIPDKLFRAKVLNHPDSVMSVIDKGLFFRKLTNTKAKSAPRTPTFTFNEREAKGWVDDGETVVARTILQGARGEGIVILKRGVDWRYAPLYTKYIDKDYEFRAHVVGGKVIAWGQKIKDKDPENPIKDPHIRTYENGFILVNRVSPIPTDFKTDLETQAVNALKFFDLDFGAVDIVVKDNTAYVLEINTAPFINSYLAPLYAEALRELAA